MASLFAWNPRYDVGRPDIDQQHQRLFQIADSLCTAMAGGRGKDQIAKTLSELITYTKTHFSYEEHLMLRSSYPKFDSHRAEHNALTKKVLDFQRAFEAGNVMMTVAVMQFIKDWLANHISERDQDFGRHLASRAA
jgi:hemerythrin